jgi:hypothetical protein
MDDVTSLKGPVEKIDGKLALLIPLVVGGNELVECSRGIAEVEGDYLKIIIPDWLAEKLSIREGQIVHVDNSSGQFNLRSSDERSPDVTGPIPPVSPST